MSNNFISDPGHSFKGAETYSGGTRYHVLTAAMGTTAQMIKPGGGRLCAVTNPAAAAQTVALSYYDSPTATSPSTAGTLIFTITPGATTSQRNPTPIDIPFQYGLVVVAASAITGTVLTGYV